MKFADETQAGPTSRRMAISQSPGDFSTQYHGRSHKYHGRLSPDKSSDMVLEYFVNHLQSSHNLILSQSTHLVN